MTSPLRFVARDSVITGWDFSTGAVKCLAFDLDGKTLAEVRLPTDLWTQGRRVGTEPSAAGRTGPGQRAGHGSQAAQTWAGLSTGRPAASRPRITRAGRIDQDRVQVRRAICWNDQSLMPYHERGLEEAGRPEEGARPDRRPLGDSLLALSHLVKDEETLTAADWERTWRILPHGSLAAGFLTGNFDQASISSAASTGIMDLRSGQWCRDMLEALANPDYRDLAWKQLPRIVDQHEPVGPLSASLALEAGIEPARRSSFPTSDDQQAGWSAAARSTLGSWRSSSATRRWSIPRRIAIAGHGQAGCHAFELGPVSVDALLHQRRPVPRPRRRQAARLAEAGRTGRGRACRRGRHDGACRSCIRSRRWA